MLGVIPPGIHDQMSIIIILSLHLISSSWAKFFLSSDLFTSPQRSKNEAIRWNSMADAIVTKQRKGLAPDMVNDIMCLKWNKRLWGLNEVVEANLRRKNKSKTIKSKNSRKAHRLRVQSRLKEIAEWDGFYDALETVADTAEKASPKEASDDQPMEEVEEIIESSESGSDSDAS